MDIYNGHQERSNIRDGFRWGVHQLLFHKHLNCLFTNFITTGYVPQKLLVDTLLLLIMFRGGSRISS
jgi:hypothetical protein